MKKKFDFGGYATKNDLKCSDGRTIRKDAFKDNDGQTVPMVWQHLHSEPANVLGHCLLENRPDGVYTYGIFNDTPSGVQAKSLVGHGDITSLSIYANKLIQKGNDVLHGAIKEVSLVLAGANPGAMIDFLAFEHSGTYETSEEEAIIYTDSVLSLSDDNDSEAEEVIKQADTEEDSGPTIKEVFDAMTDEQKGVVYFMLAHALTEEEIKQSDESGGEEEVMKKNIFENTEVKNEEGQTLSHSDMQAIFDDAKSCGSLKQAFIAHGITDIDYLFPEARLVNPTPDFIKREDAWVSTVWGGFKKSPFSRIKSMTADITGDDARAKGYIKGKLKLEEQFALLKRTTTPHTIYKKQKLDRDDIIDITDMDVVGWLKLEMRGMLNEEICRTAFVGDGRASDSDDKIPEANVRPIFRDVDMYTIHKTVTYPANPTVTDKANALVEAALRARIDYKGSGSPTLFIDPDSLVTMLLATDTTGRCLYESETQLAAKLRVSSIVEVPILENQTRDVTVGEITTTYKLLGLIVNLKDYVLGADRGGEVNMFDDFDIDYNQYKYLMETRVSGALIKPYSAISLEEVVT